MDREKIDSQNLYADIRNFPQQIKEGYSIGMKADLKVENDFSDIVLVGMGGSALAGEIIRSYFSIKVPFAVSRDYELPSTVTKNSLVIAISYSGNTEETLTAIKEAWRKGCAIIAVTSGEKMDAAAREKKAGVVKLPRGYPQKIAITFMTSALLAVFQRLGLIKQQNIDEAAEILQKQDILKERANELAEKLVDKIPAIYSSERMRGVALKWKIAFNENCKLHALQNTFPELNHNEMLGYVNPRAKHHVIIINDDEDYPRTRHRMDITKRIIKGQGIDVTEINITGRNPMTRLLSAMLMGDYVSYYLAIKSGTDPSDEKILELFRKTLK